jgi:hypothetical protein
MGEGVPISGASVAGTSTRAGVNRTTATDRDGRFTLTFASGEGDYFITVRAIGYVPRRFEVKRTADQDILIADVRLSPAVSVLDTLVTVGQRDRPARNDKATDVGGTERGVNAGLVASEQIGNLSSMAASVAGALLVQGANGDPTGYSVLGLDASQNGLSLNGMNSNATDLPRDANLSVSVATSPYDVSQGQFSGARLNASVGSGSNYVTRTSSALVNAPQLEWTDRIGHALGQRYLNLNASGLAAGPITYDKSFYSIAYQIGRRSNDLRTLLNTDVIGLETIGIAVDSVRHLLSALDRIGVSTSVAGFPNDRLSDQALVLGSLDFAAPSATSGGAFNLTFNGGVNRQTPGSSLTSAVPASGFDVTRWNGGVQGHHTTFFAVGILSESGVAVTGSRQDVDPYLDIPSGTVVVNSTLANGQSAVQPISFGGAQIRSTSSFNSIDLSNQLSWFSVNNRHRVKLTSELRHDAHSIDQGTNILGMFAFNSLADLDAGLPTTFTRQVAPLRVSGQEWIGALSLGDSYRATPDLQVQYGARVDMQRFADGPTPNPEIERSFGMRNDRLPSGAAVSPRVGFSWTYGTAPEIQSFEGAAAAPRAVVRGGIGIFRNALDVTLPAQAIANTGLATGLQQFTCVGGASPVPNWPAYANDPSSIPTGCVERAGDSLFANAAPNVTLFSDRYAPQMAIRSTLQWSGATLGNRILASITGTYSRNENQTGFVDLNVDSRTRFTLASEGNRPVYVAPTSIVPRTGAIASGDGRVIPTVNRVTELRSDLSSVSKQVTVLLSPRLSSTQYTWGLSYTLNYVRDRAYGFTSTSGDPFTVESARSSLDWRHQVLLSFGYNVFDTVRLFWVQSILSGLPYTPNVVGDVNGDGYGTNDRAFIFDPAQAAEASLRAGMAALLAAGSSRVRDCLGRQVGQVAARNSCEGPWTSTASMRIDFNPAKVRMPRRTAVSFSIANPLGAADLLLHGENRLHGWGQALLPDSRLLVVRGFDPTDRRYIYQVNSRFGSTTPAANTARNPVIISVLCKFEYGPTRERQDLMRVLDQGRGQAGTKLTASELQEAYRSAGLLNPMATILRASDTLDLTGRQADSIAGMNRQYALGLDSIWSPLVREYADLPADFDRGAAYDRYRHAREASVDLLLRFAPSINALLSGDQHRKLPSLIASHLDRRYLLAIRSGITGLDGPVFPTGVGVPNAGGQMRARSPGGL